MPARIPTIAVAFPPNCDSHALDEPTYYCFRETARRWVRSACLGFLCVRPRLGVLSGRALDNGLDNDPPSKPEMA